MRHSVSIRSLFLAILVLCPVTLNSFSHAQSIVLASAELGNTGQVGGTAIGINEFFGWRFTTSVPLAVEQVGGHMYAIPDQPGNIFAALVRLASLSSMPVGSPFTESELIAKTTFRPNFPSDDFLTPMSATLIPGCYALIFGTGLFDASGGAGLVNGADQHYIPPTDDSSDITWRIPSPGGALMWGPAQVENMRFVIVGHQTSFPADFEGDNDVDSDDLAIWNEAYGINPLGDADGDGDSDGRDFLDWQRQYTGALEVGSPATTIVPEPGGMLLAGLAAICWIVCRFPC